MRVTKTIKNYISKQVDLKCNESCKEIEELKKERDRIKNSYNKFCDNFKKEVAEPFLKGIKELGYKVDNDDNIISIRDYNIVNDNLKSICNRIRILERKLREYKEDKIEEIIFKLEMGAKKEEIDDMLNDIDFKYRE